MSAISSVPGPLAGPAWTSPSSTGDRWRAFVDGAARTTAVGIGFSIPVSTSLAEILTTLFVTCWLLQGDLRGRLQQIARNPVAVVSAAMFLWMALATTYSTVSWAQSSRCLLKYREFLYLPMLVTVFAGDERLRRLALRSFYIGAGVAMALSYGEWAFGYDAGLPSTNGDYVVAKDRIIHSLFIALLLFCAALELYRPGTRRDATGNGRRRRWLYGSVIVLASINLLFMVHGRTGYVVMGVLIVLALTQQHRLRGFVAGLVLVGCLGLMAHGISAGIKSRATQTVRQIEHQFGGPQDVAFDPRLQFYKTTLVLLCRHPLIGTGTGSFAKEYAGLADVPSYFPTSDPHSEYLHLATQLGIPGALGFVALLALQWWLARRLPPFEARLAHGTTALIGVGALFNSLIMSVTGGLIFAWFSGLAFSEWPGMRRSGTTGAAPAPLPHCPDRLNAAA